MATTSRTAIYYQERAGLLPTRRAPRPAAAPGLNIGLDTPVSPPLPQPEYLKTTQGQPSPDRGTTRIWPHGIDGETIQ